MSNKDTNKKNVLLVFFFAFIFFTIYIISHPNNIKITIKWEIHPGNKTSIFFSEKDKFFNERNSIHKIISTTDNEYEFNIKTTKNISKLRIDPTEFDADIKLYRLSIENGKSNIVLDASNLLMHIKNLNGIQIKKLPDNSIQIKAIGNDPNFEIELSPQFKSATAVDKLIHAAIVLMKSIIIYLSAKILFKTIITTKKRMGDAKFYSKTLNITGLIILIFSMVHLTRLHPWWNINSVIMATEKDGARHTVSKFTKDAKILVYSIDANLPIGLDDGLRKAFINYSIEEYLYPRRIYPNNKTNLILFESHIQPDKNCQIFKSYGSATIYKCHEH